MVGPSSIPFERWTSTLTLLSVAFVVFSTVPVEALVAESYDRTKRAPARTSSKVSPRANWVPDSSPPSPFSDSESLLCSPDSDPLPDSESLLQPMRASTRTKDGAFSSCFSQFGT